MIPDRLDHLLRAHRYLAAPVRIWLQAREDAKARAGAAFSLKDFHSKALSLGAMGLEPPREALAPFQDP